MNVPSETTSREPAGSLTASLRRDVALRAVRLVYGLVEMTRDASLSDAPHEHLWDTEMDEFSTFTPDPKLDEPWVIHECCVPGCDALKINRPIWREGRQTLVYEVAK